MQVALFIQGDDKHSSISVWHLQVKGNENNVKTQNNTSVELSVKYVDFQFDLANDIVWVVFRDSGECLEDFNLFKLFVSLTPGVTLSFSNSFECFWRSLDIFFVGCESATVFVFFL